VNRFTSGSLLATFALAALASTPGCGLTLDSGGDDASAPDTGVVPADSGGGDAGSPDAPPDAGPVECVVASDCTTLHGMPPCGAWECNANACDVVCPNCTDADRDGYGVGPGCAGGDCADGDDQIGPTATDSCYAGPPGTSGVGPCGGGATDCYDGVWTPCLGSVVPSPESCNGIDDDCNGSVDETFGTIGCGLGTCARTSMLCAGGSLATCLPGPITSTTDGCNAADDDCDGRVDENCGSCVFVATTGNDGSTNPTVSATPFRNVQNAIDWAAADALRPQRVCLLASSCTATSVFAGAVRMRQGVAVQGNFGPGGTSRCGATLRTEIVTATSTGVLFDSAIASTTELSDVVVTPSAIAGAATSAAITVDGALGATIRGVVVQPGPVVTNGYGIDVINGGDALVTASSVSGGRGSAESIGIRAVGGTVEVVDDCPAYDSAGRCTMGCGPSTAGQGVRGRFDSTGTMSARAMAILLRDAPGSVVDGVSICALDSTSGAGIRIEGDADGVVVRQSFVAGWGGRTESWGIDAGPCAGSAPWIVDNFRIDGEGPPGTPQGGVRARGDCHAVIERNLRITGGLEGAGVTWGVLCAEDSGVASRCVIDSNVEIRGALMGFPRSATGVECAGESCARVSLNGLISGVQGTDVVGLRLGGTDALVDRNVIVGGCATTSAIGVVATGSAARFQNNLVSATGRCLGGTTMVAPRYVGMRVEGGPAFDVRSNDVDGVGAPAASCESRGIELASGPAGLFRGNIVLGGACPSSVTVLETSASADPFAMESNDLVPATGGVYADEGATVLTTAAAVDALTDARFAANIDANPMFIAYPADLHIAGTSMCVDRDLASAPPAYDHAGLPRSPPDIGAFEH
jgi:hypothetical protein